MESPKKREERGYVKGSKRLFLPPDHPSYVTPWNGKPPQSLYAGDWKQIWAKNPPP